MSKSMKIALVVIVLIAAALGGYYFTQAKQAKNSFAPDRPEQAALAKEHAVCAAFYSLPQAHGGKVVVNSDAFLKFHTDTGLNFSEDKEAFNANVKTVSAQLADEVAAAQKNGGIDKFLDDKDASCRRLMDRSGDFIADVMHQRSGKK